MVLCQALKIQMKYCCLVQEGKRELIALLNLSSWYLVMVEPLFFVVPRGCLWFVIVVFPDHTHLLFLSGSALSDKTKTITRGRNTISFVTLNIYTIDHCKYTVSNEK